MSSEKHGLAFDEDRFKYWRKNSFSGNSTICLCFIGVSQQYFQVSAIAVNTASLNTFRNKYQKFLIITFVHHIFSWQLFSCFSGLHTACGPKNAAHHWYPDLDYLKSTYGEGTKVRQLVMSLIHTVILACSYLITFI